MRAALDGARQIGFTVVSISVSLIAAFIPLLFMDGVVGRLLREFSVTLVFAIAVSTVVSLTVTPMICAHFVQEPPSRDAHAARPHRRGRAWAGLMRGYMRSLDGRRCAIAVLMRHRHAGHRRRDGQSLHQDAQGLLPAGRHRARVRLHAGVGRHLLRRDGEAAAARRSTSCWPIPRSPASAPRSARRASMPPSTRGACSSA